jgi:hypothetical protein
MFNKIKEIKVMILMKRSVKLTLSLMVKIMKNKITMSLKKIKEQKKFKEYVKMKKKLVFQ